MKRLTLVTCLLAAQGCGYLPALPGSEPQLYEPTIATLEPVVRAAPAREVASLSLLELADRYREVLAVAEDPAQRLQVRRRLADLELLAREAEDIEDGAPVSYAEVIAAYEELLQDYPDTEGSDQLMYQMARAYDMDGSNPESVALMERLSIAHPGSEHLAEAEFRKGEAYFSDGDYRRAEQAYAQVAGAAGAEDYRASSLYMLGWSRFKLDRKEAAVDAFTESLDTLLASGDEFEALPRGDREMAADCFRVMAVIFDGGGGATAVAESFAQRGPRSYDHRVYLALGELYLEQERYQDSADTFAGFAAAKPFSPVAHEFDWRVIGAYESGGFPEAVIAAKASYAARYDTEGAYWQKAEDEQRSIMGDRLRQYIDELARHNHALAQGEEDDAAAAPLYHAAADYYGDYIRSFPRDEQVPDLALLMAEARQAGGDYRRAIEDYQWMAYRYSEHPQASEAAYAAILAFDQLTPVEDDDAAALVASQLQFAKTFPVDDRAAPVLARAVSGLLEAEEYALAADNATVLINWQPAPGSELLVPAWLQLGHARFELAHYDEAEAAYFRALALMSDEDVRRAKTTEQLAAAIYRQGEIAATAGDHLAAADHYARIVAVAPNSSVRVNAQYDAANSYRIAGDLNQANQLLLDFRRRYPQHALSAGVGAVLVQNYETLGDWRGAAEELDRLGETAVDADEKREAQYLAADYYLREGAIDTAIERYRTYAHAWPQPMGPRMEAMLTLAGLYQDQGDVSKRHYWLEAMAAAHEQAGGNATDRSRYLAASSMTEIADAHYATFVELRLAHPLEKSLARKRDALDDTVTAYERVNSYGLQEYGTRATYRLGQVYRQFSADLMNSERPDGLDALALEQYELLLEEQAWPFEEKAIAIHEANAKRAWDGLYDEWIALSFSALGDLMPARWGKQEARVAVSREIR
ncbi:tetratricopeptide repeat protein [Halioglobus maricola]|uniref:Tetratricopeptide repeat protein n=1 Tax=Halioglobus maricola TaxID=2601894 RepID=A0A5P9NN47_9GAMM|nr:tetratricopeptide repeat protein [Halioglobus maricola]QFU77217.1 tetratricopeptide repeat protein [Halioglobus maricola]